MADRNYSPMLQIKINSINNYSDKFYLMKFMVYGHDIELVNMLPKGKAHDLFGEDLSLFNPDQVYMIYSNGAYVNCIRERKGW